jgi:O-antigen ligase
MTGRGKTALIYLAAVLAYLVALNLAFNLAPSATQLNQVAAWVGFGGLSLTLSAPDSGRRCVANNGARARKCGVLCLATIAALFAAIATKAHGHPASLGLIMAGTLAGATGSATVGAWLASTDNDTRERTLIVLQTIVVLAAIIGMVVGAVQVFAPRLADGQWIAAPTTSGRAIGNLRQPNHLASVLLWGMIAAVWLREVATPRPSSAARGAAWAWTAMSLLLLGLVLTASRTGTAGVLVLAAWGLLDRRLSRSTRVALMVSPLVYAAIWWIVDAAMTTGGSTFAGTQRLTQEGLSTSRWAIWANTLELIGMHPWTGVGLGEFNFAWTLTEFSTPRPLEFFDHSHNLVLQLWVELGLPLGTLVLALLGYALWRAFRAPAYAPDARTALMQRCAFMIVLLSLMHSMLEYPLWYAHFLFPVAFFWGICLARPQPAVSAGAALVQAAGEDAGAAAPTGLARKSWGTLAIGAALMAGGVLMLVDYLRVVPIFDPPAHAAPLPERIAAGQRSWFFAHHADYALVTTYKEPVRTLDDFRRPTHFLLDARLMQAWAEALAAAGDVDRARWVAQRLAEFQRPSSHAFFAPCEAPATDGASRPFQCEPPSRRYTFEDFR